MFLVLKFTLIQKKDIYRYLGSVIIFRWSTYILFLSAWHQLYICYNIFIIICNNSYVCLHRYCSVLNIGVRQILL